MFRLVCFLSLSLFCGLVLSAAPTFEGNSWPWQVQMRYHGRHHCGGTLISDQWFVTAAHCVSRTRLTGHSFSAVFGEHNMYDSSERKKSVTIVDILFHPRYDSQKLVNDIALLRLERPLSLNDDVMPICLPNSTFAIDAGTIVTVTGWGHMTHGDGGRLPPFVQQADMPVVDDKYCEKAYEDFIPNTQICAGEGGVTCQGDSGGPMVYFPPDGGPAVLVGIASYGRECAEQDYPGVYTRVTSYLDWIQEIIVENPRSAALTVETVSAP